VYVEIEYKLYSCKIHADRLNLFYSIDYKEFELMVSVLSGEEYSVEFVKVLS
jgi:hypothetical protein